MSIIEDSRMTVLHSNTIDNYFIYIHFLYLEFRFVYPEKFTDFFSEVNKYLLSKMIEEYSTDIDI